MFTGGVGLNTVLDPVRVPYNTESGVSALTATNNITLDDSGRPGRRVGQTLITAGDFHTMFCDGGDCYVGKTTYLYQMGLDESLRGVRSGMSGDRISMVQVNEDIYYGNGTDNGILRSGVSYAWPDQTTHVGGTTNRKFSVAPVGNHLAAGFGRMFIAEGPVVWYSEPFAFGKYNKTRCYIPFKSDVLMVKMVESGAFFSDRKSTWFIRMKDVAPKDWDPKEVANYPALEWSDAIDYVEGKEIGFAPGLCALWASPEGSILGTADGQLINLTKNNIVYDRTTVTGASLLHGYNFIHCME